MARGYRFGGADGGTPIAVNTPIGDLTGTYSCGSALNSTATKTSAILVPRIVSGQKVRVNISNTDYNANYKAGLYYSTDGNTWNLLSETGANPVTKGNTGNVDFGLTDILGNRVYFRLVITRISTGGNSKLVVNSVVCGTFT